MRKIKLTWEKLIGIDDFEQNLEFLQQNGGIYIWIIQGSPDRIYYIGEAKNFYTRFIDHFCMTLGGKYTCFNIDKETDFIEFLKKHYSNKTIDEVNSENNVYIPALNGIRCSNISFQKAFCDQEWNNIRFQSLINTRYAFATLEKPEDSGLRKEIEGGLIKELWGIYCDIAGVELNRRGARSNHPVIGAITRYPRSKIEIEHRFRAAIDLPEEFTNITTIK